MYWSVEVRAADRVLNVGQALQLDEKTARWIARRLRALLGR
jgi:hypothetical protein